MANQYTAYWSPGVWLGGGRAWGHVPQQKSCSMWVIQHLLRRQLLLWWYIWQQRVRVRVMIGCLVRGRVRIKIRIRVGVTFNVRATTGAIVAGANAVQSPCETKWTNENLILWWLYQATPLLLYSFFFVFFFFFFSFFFFSIFSSSFFFLFLSSLLYFSKRVRRGGGGVPLDPKNNDLFVQYIFFIIFFFYCMLLCSSDRLAMYKNTPTRYMDNFWFKNIWGRGGGGRCRSRSYYKITVSSWGFWCGTYPSNEYICSPSLHYFTNVHDYSILYRFHSYPLAIQVFHLDSSKKENYKWLSSSMTQNTISLRGIYMTY